MMKLAFTKDSWADYLWFQEYEPKLLKRINELIKDIQRNPFTGIGKPEPLKANLSSYWSRRISSEHRLVYKVTDSEIIFARLSFITASIKNAFQPLRLKTARVSSNQI